MKSILCIVPMRKMQGYAYVDYFPSNTFGNQVRLFNVFSQTKLTFEEFKKLDSVEMVPRFLMNGNARLRKYKELYKWEKLQEYDIGYEKSLIKFRSGIPSKLERLADWLGLDTWYTFDDNNFNVKTEWEHTENSQAALKRMPIWTHYNYIGVTDRIEMYWALKRNQSIKDLFKEELKTSIPTKLNYHIVLNSCFLTDEYVLLTD